MRTFLKIVLGSFLIYFASWYFLFKTNINTLPIQSEDTVSTIFTSVAIIKDHSLYIDKYYQMLIQRYPHPDDKNQLKGLTPFYLKKVGDHYLTAFPIITSIVALPVFIPIILGAPITWDNLIILSHIASSLIMAITVWFFYLLLRKKIKLNENQTNLLTIIFAFGTINFAMFSQALWQYGTLQLFLILGLYFSYSQNLFLSGFFSGLAFLTRPTSLLPVVFYPVFNYFYVSGNKQKFNLNRIVSFVFGVLVTLLFFYWYNNTFYKDISNQGYAAQLFGSWLSHFPEGFLGIWISPSKGVLVFSPVFVFSIFGFYISVINALSLVKTKKSVDKPLKNIEKTNTLYTNLTYIFFGLIVFAHTFVMGFWKHWYGGYSFGYRMAGDVIPFLVLMLVPFITSTFYSKKVLKNIFIIFVVISVLVQFYGMVFFDSIWHNAYDTGFRNTSWLWSVNNSEAAFNIRRVMVKLKLLDKACEKCEGN